MGDHLGPLILPKAEAMCPWGEGTGRRDNYNIWQPFHGSWRNKTDVGPWSYHSCLISGWVTLTSGALYMLKDSISFSCPRSKILSLNYLLLQAELGSSKVRKRTPSSLGQSKESQNCPGKGFRGFQCWRGAAELWISKSSPPEPTKDFRSPHASPFHDWPPSAWAQWFMPE